MQGENYSELSTSHIAIFACSLERFGRYNLSDLFGAVKLQGRLGRIPREPAFDAGLVRR